MFCSDPKQIEQLWNRLYVCNVDTLTTSGTPLDACKSHRRSRIHPPLDPGVLRSILTRRMGRTVAGTERWHNEAARMKRVMWSGDTLRSGMVVEERFSLSAFTLRGQWSGFFSDTEAQLMTTWTTSYFFASDSVQNVGKFPKMASRKAPARSVTRLIQL